MKKLLGGCLVAGLLLGAGLAVAGYFAYRAARPTLDSARAYLAGLSGLGDLSAVEAELTRTEAYAPPATGELTADQVARFVRVQQHVRDALGARMDEIEAKYRNLKLNRDDAQAASVADALRALGEVSRVVVDGRRFQVEALNRERFSRTEYEWVRARVYQAAGHELAGGLDLGQVERLARGGLADAGVAVPDVRLPSVPLPEVPARNRELVRPVADRLGEWLPLAFFGL
ncbi:MAG: hypothetical protein AB7H88_19605 [Vicinamibacterales bacterium]